MTDHAQTRRAQWLRAQAALDDELEAANALAFDHDLTADEGLRRLRESGEALRRTLRTHAVIEPAPDALRARVLAMAQPQRAFRGPPRSMALAASFRAVSFLAGYFLGAREAASSDETELRPWSIPSLARRFRDSRSTSLHPTVTL